MGVRNYLVEGVSTTGKTTVCRELARRGYEAINGDAVLAYQGDPATGEATDTRLHEHHLWDVARVRALAADQRQEATFFCGGSRNFAAFIDLFDEVFVLDVDADTLRRRLDRRPAGEWGSQPAERDLVLRLHRTREDVPSTGVVIDAARPVSEVVDEILRHAGLVAAGVSTRVDESATEHDADELWPVYDAVFADQPDRETWQRDVWDRHRTRDGFRLARAHDDGGLVGFAYGYTGQRGQWWTDRAREVLDPDVAGKWLGGHFELVSIGVLERARRAGVGRRLLHALLHDLPHERWVLMTSADASDPARRLYASEGWQVLGPGIGEGRVIMGRRSDRAS